MHANYLPHTSWKSPKAFPHSVQAVVVRQGNPKPEEGKDLPTVTQLEMADSNPSPSGFLRMLPAKTIISFS